jgi:hypothetical protein
VNRTCFITRAETRESTRENTAVVPMVRAQKSSQFKPKLMGCPVRAAGTLRYPRKRRAKLMSLPGGDALTSLL